MADEALALELARASATRSRSRRSPSTIGRTITGAPRAGAGRPRPSSPRSRRRAAARSRSPTRSASPPPRRIGSSVTSAPASRARRGRRVVAPVAHDDGDHLHPVELARGSRRRRRRRSPPRCRPAGPRRGACPSGRAAARSQSNRSLPSASTSSRIAPLVRVGARTGAAAPGRTGPGRDHQDEDQPPLVAGHDVEPVEHRVEHRRRSESTTSAERQERSRRSG